MRKLLKAGVVAAFVLSWLFLAWYAYRMTLEAYMRATFSPYQDVARRVTSPNGRLTAVLVRDLGYPDLNFRLYLTGPGRAVRVFVADPLPEVEQPVPIWVSHDYEPTTLENWHEDIEWSTDSSVIAVRIQGQWAFAYDLQTATEHQDPATIERLLSARGGAQPTRTP